MVRLFFLFFVFFSDIDSENGKKLFLENCIACHQGGKNLIIPEKNLQYATLVANSMDSISAISYQITNGKNGMPAFGGRLKQKEIELISIFVLKNNFP
jgi:cytochrome c6